MPLAWEYRAYVTRLAVPPYRFLDLFQSSRPRDLQEDSVSVADYSPKTTLASDQAGNVTMERKAEKSNPAGVTLSSPVDWPGKVTASSDLGQKAAGGIFGLNKVAREERAKLEESTVLLEELAAALA